MCERRCGLETKGDPGFHEDCLPFVPPVSIITPETLKAGKMGNDHCMSVGVGDAVWNREACPHSAEIPPSPKGNTG